LRLIENVERNPESVQAWWGRLHSAFVYAGEDSKVLPKLARLLTGDHGTVLREMDPDAEEFEVTNDLEDFCGVMAGVRVTVSKAEAIRQSPCAPLWEEHDWCHFGRSRRDFPENPI
jgi:hypothetical protein